MDWSLGNPYAKNPLLRDVLAFRRVWVYYVAMVLDVVIRFNWIVYAIFVKDIQHSAVMSFVVSVSEVFRRGVWSIFRVENEHCTNVLLFRASRDIPLPYELPAATTPGLDGAQMDDLQLREQAMTPFMAPVDIEQGTPSGSSLRARRPSIAHVGHMIKSAHTQDFERRRRPSYLGSGKAQEQISQDAEESTDEEDDGALTSDEGSVSTADAPVEDPHAAADRRAQMHRIAE